jgi:hypothetical protein
MAVVNRCTVAVSPRQPMLEWTLPFRSPLDGEAQQGEASIYLISPYDNEPRALERLRVCHGAIFEAELEMWCRDRGLWPSDRSAERFLGCFDVAFHQLVDDLGDELLRSDQLATEFEQQLRQTLG